MAFFCQFHPVRIYDKALSNRDERQAEFKRFLGLAGRLDLPGGNHWNASVDMIQNHLRRGLVALSVDRHRFQPNTLRVT